MNDIILKCLRKPNKTSINEHKKDILDLFRPESELLYQTQSYNSCKCIRFTPDMNTRQVKYSILIILYFEKMRDMG